MRFSASHLQSLPGIAEKVAHGFQEKATEFITRNDEIPDEFVLILVRLSDRCCSKFHPYADLTETRRLGPSASCLKNRPEFPENPSQ